MRAAIVDLSSNVIVNVVILSSYNDIPPENFIFIPINQETPHGIGWIYNKKTNEFINPNPTSLIPDTCTIS